MSFSRKLRAPTEVVVKKRDFDARRASRIDLDARSEGLIARSCRDHEATRQGEPLAVHIRWTASRLHGFSAFHDSQSLTSRPTAACPSRSFRTGRSACEDEPMATQDSLDRLESEVVRCRLCPRLVEWRERAAQEPPRRFAGQTYWARPVPSLGDPRARVLVVGLAPAAHGGNRTGRIFTGDRSGDWLFAALHRAGFANQPVSVRRGDGLRLEGVYVTAVNRCCPPGNRPTPAERDNCLPYLVRELQLFSRVRVAVALGAFAWDGVLRAIAAAGHRTPRPRARFAHGAEASAGPYTMLGCYHPSQLNTSTGVLTRDMLDEVVRRARALSEEL